MGLYDKIVCVLDDIIFDKTDVLLKNADLDYFALFIQNDEEIAFNLSSETVKGEELCGMGYNPISNFMPV